MEQGTTKAGGTLADRLSAILAAVRGNAANPIDDAGEAYAPYRIVHESDGSVKVWVASPDGDRLVGRGRDLEAAITALETKLRLTTPAQGGA